MLLFTVGIVLGGIVECTGGLVVVEEETGVGNLGPSGRGSVIFIPESTMFMLGLSEIGILSFKDGLLLRLISEDTVFATTPSLVLLIEVAFSEEN